jgi:hypothetical protein
MEKLEEKNKKMTPLSQIHKFCVDCLGGQPKLVKGCTSKNCPLYPYRTGHNTNSKRAMTEEQRQMAVERLKKAREAKKGE